MGSTWRVQIWRARRRWPRTPRAPSRPRTRGRVGAHLPEHGGGRGGGGGGGGREAEGEAEQRGGRRRRRGPRGAGGAREELLVQGVALLGRARLDARREQLRQRFGRERGAAGLDGEVHGVRGLREPRERGGGADQGDAHGRRGLEPRVDRAQEDAEGLLILLCRDGREDQLTGRLAVGLHLEGGHLLPQRERRLQERRLATACVE